MTHRHHEPIAELVAPKITGDKMSVVLLDRVTRDLPDYCIHGKTTCYHCDDWCWLGDKTAQVVKSGEAAPLCMECADKLIPNSGAVKTDRIEDHERKAGPHA